MLRIPIAKPGYPYLLSLLSLAIISYVLFNQFVSLFFVILLFVIGWFFRDPVRNIPSGEDMVLSPADGKVIKIEEVVEPEFISGPALKVSIFLSLFNVHINRAPLKGDVVYNRYVAGGFFAAYKDEAPARNERNLIGLKTAAGKILLVQIAGLVARCIVCSVNPGDVVEPGMRIGMIKFGSCTEIYLPPGTAIKIKKGDKVRGGETVIGKLNVKQNEKGKSAISSPCAS